MSEPTKSLRDIDEMTDSEVKERYEYLCTQTHLGSWGEREKSIAGAELTKRKIKH